MSAGVSRERSWAMSDCSLSVLGTTNNGAASAVSRDRGVGSCIGIAVMLCDADGRAGEGVMVRPAVLIPNIELSHRRADDAGVG